MATSPCPVIMMIGGGRPWRRTSARNSSPSIPGIFTSLTTQQAFSSPGHARAASAEENACTA